MPDRFQLTILDNTETPVSILSNRLPNTCPISDFRTIREAIEGGGYSDKCQLIIPAAHPDADHVAEGNYVVFQDPDGYWQEYKLMTPERVDGNDGSYITATGEHAFYELRGEPVRDMRPTDTTAAAAVTQVLQGTRWQLGYADDLGTNSVRIYDTSVLAGLVAIATQWGGELRFRLSVIGGVIAGRYVDILTRRGSVTGKRFELKKDILQIRQTRDIQSLCSALIGRGKGVEVEGGTQEDPAYGRRLDFSDVVWSVASGYPIDKPAGQDWIGDDTAADTYGPGGRHIYDRIYFDDCTDPETLLQLTWDALQQRKVPLVTYEMSVLTLEDVSGYAHEAVRFGDTVYVINTSRIPAITGEARIIQYDRSYIQPMTNAVVLGNYLPKLQDDMVDMKLQQRAMRDRAGVWDRATVIESNAGGDLQYRMSLLVTQLYSVISGFSTDENGNFLWENQAKTGAMMINGEGFMIANTKTGDTYNWRTFGTGDGFLADEIIGGTIRAGIVFAGTLAGVLGTFETLIAGDPNKAHMTLGADGNGDPFVRIYDNDGELQQTINKFGTEYGNGSILKMHTLGTRTGLGIF